MKRRSAIVVGLVFALSMLGAVNAAASTSEFDFHIGDKFLEDFGFPPGDVAQAANGDTITVIGLGEFDVSDRDADGEGTFEHRSGLGELLAFGTWEAKRLMRFENFGGQADLPPNLIGGRAVIKIHVKAHPASNPDATQEFDAILTVDCAIGNFPPGFEEGITFDAGFINFNEKVSGFTVFVAGD